MSTITAPPQCWTRPDYVAKFARLRGIIGADAKTIIEIGAHYGEDSMRLASTFPLAQVHCFEPDPRNATVFRKHVDLHAINLFEVAVSCGVGESDLYLAFADAADADAVRAEKYAWISEEDYRGLKLHRSGATSLKRSNEHLIGTVRVPTTSLDAWAAEHLRGAPVDLIWIDVQGAERDVIHGAIGTLEHTRFVWMEYGEGRIYPDAMSKGDTLVAMASVGFAAMYSEGGEQGDILFRNTQC